MLPAPLPPEYAAALSLLGMPSDFVNAITRAQLLGELESYLDDDGLNHVVTPDHEPIRDLTVLDGRRATRPAEARSGDCAAVVGGGGGE